MRYGTMFLTAIAAMLAFAPAAMARVDHARVERAADGSLVLRWTADRPVDLFMASDPDATAKQAVLIAHDDADGVAVVAAPAAGRPYFFVREGRKGAATAVAERLLPLQHASNFRDLGGYPAAGGRHVRWGMIYRSGATPLLSDADYLYLDGLGIRSVIDLRSAEERQIAPDLLPGRTGARYFAKDYSMAAQWKQFAATAKDMGAKDMGAKDSGAKFRTIKALYGDWLVTLAPQFRVVFEDLIARNGAVVYHCSAGQDRTGVATALVLSALGVPRDVILADYHLSTGYRQPENELPIIDPAKFPGNPMVAMARTSADQPVRKPEPLTDETGAALLEATFARIDAQWGSVERYLDQVLGVDAGEVARLRAVYTR